MSEIKKSLEKLSESITKRIEGAKKKALEAINNSKTPPKRTV